MSTITRILLIAILCLVLSHEIEVCWAKHQGPKHQGPKHQGAKHLPQQRPLPVQNLGAQINCKEKCDFRCSLASRYRMCFRACNTCCQRCNCVPPGTSGNAEVCPCYNNITTHNGRKKCP